MHSSYAGTRRRFMSVSQSEGSKLESLIMAAELAMEALISEERGVLTDHTSHVEAASEGRGASRLSQ